MKKTGWPNGAKCAFAFGWDLDGDTIWNPKVNRLPGGHDFIRSRSAGMYGPLKAAYRILDMMAKYNLKSTWFIPAVNVERFPDLACMIRDAGHEIAHHGYDHDSFYGNTASEQMATIQKSQELFTEILGKPAVGFRPTGDLLPETELTLLQNGHSLYMSKDVGEESCRFIEINGIKTEAVHVPCRVELDDYLQLVYNPYPPVPSGLPRIAPYEAVLTGFIREIEGAARFGNAVSTAFHPQVSGTPGKSVILEKLFEYLVSNPDVWCATCEEVAAYWKEERRGHNAATST